MASKGAFDIQSTIGTAGAKVLSAVFFNSILWRIKNQSAMLVEQGSGNATVKFKAGERGKTKIITANNRIFYASALGGNNATLQTLQTHNHVDL